ncbi:arylsulfatase I-like [Amphiura filiformis]|uniref:arylsulfatase I-like n=1 Tax=Amphiura filiformis TaxID=82378 RepID=UPI003B221FCB
MTGLYQSRHGVDRALSAGDAGCLPSNLTLLPQVLKRHGYTTHLVGKWHLGHSRRNCLPNQRGFDTFLGFRNGAQNYYTHRHSNPRVARDMGVEYFEGFDFWENETVAESYTGQYATHIYVKRAEEIIAYHAHNGKPFFLFLSLSAVHMPAQVPENYMHQYEGNIADPLRKIYAGMTSCMDEGIKNITDTLQRLDVWKDTVVVFSSDNGGAPEGHGSNLPLLGHKAIYFEGGIRVAAFVNSPLLSKQVQGTEYTGLMGMADWLPTFVEGIARGSKDHTIDGINMWDSIRYGIPSPRKEYVHAVGGNCDWNQGDEPLTMYGTIRVGDWKLHIGAKGQRAFVEKTVKQQCSESSSRLHNMRLDPYETSNQYHKERKIYTTLLKRLKYHCRRKVQYLLQIERKEANPRLLQGVYTPWLDDWDELEWHPTNEDVEIFNARYITRERFCDTTRQTENNSTST